MVIYNKKYRVFNIGKNYQRVASFSNILEEIDHVILVWSLLLIERKLVVRAGVCECVHVSVCVCVCVKRDVQCGGRPHGRAILGVHWTKERP